MVNTFQTPIQYFQVTAAVIPTLLIALAVGIRTSDRLAPAMTRATGLKRYAFLLLIALVAIVIGGAEVASLEALVLGSGTVFSTIVAFLGVIFCFGLVLDAFLHPLLAKLETPQQVFLIGMVTAGILAGIWSFVRLLRDSFGR